LNKGIIPFHKGGEAARTDVSSVKSEKQMNLQVNMNNAVIA
jgi:hypothetical protein